jgi:drug/metabolite transporter (DMT)-like permease
LNSGENRAAGIVWMLATMLCFVALDAIMKYNLQSQSLVQVTWGRFFFASIFAALACGRNLPRLAISKAPRAQLIRSLFLMATTGLFNAGISSVPLAMGTTIMFMSPIVVTLLSTLVLGEHVGIRRWASIVVGFLGALIVIRVWETGLTGLNHGALFLLCAAFTNAAYQISTRSLRNESPLTTLLFTAAAGAVVTSFLLPWHWSTPTPQEWLLLVASGAAGCLGHLCLIKALQAAPASVVAPFSYSSLIWAGLFGFVIWRDVPATSTLIGAALIIASGLYIFMRERRLKASGSHL